MEAGGSAADVEERMAFIDAEAARQEKASLSQYGMLEGTDPSVAPLRRALAVWGMNADDVNVISIHGTSTKANDKNETGIYNDIFTQLGRTKGNAVPVIAQKGLTGHPKGAAVRCRCLCYCCRLDVYRSSVIINLHLFSLSAIFTACLAV